MEITFEFWGELERLAGGASRPLRLAAAEPTVADALALLATELPPLAARLETVAVAIGDRLVARSEPLSADARLALLPPVAGG